MAEIIIKEKVKDQNEFTLAGHMAMRRETKKSLNVTFRCQTYERDKPYTNTISIVVLDDELKSQFLAVPLGSKVMIKGHMRSAKTERDNYGRPIAPVSRAAFERKAESDLEELKEAAANEGRTLTWREQLPKKYRSSQYFVASSIEQIDENERDKDELLVVGNVEDTFVSQNGNIRFMVRTNAEGSARLSFSVFPQEGVDYLSLMKFRTKVKIKARCVSYTVPTENGIEYTEMYMIDKIEKA